MAASQSSDVEILVHVTAPSRTADDVVYRQLAQSYLSFQPRSHVVVSGESQHNENRDDEDVVTAERSEQRGVASSSADRNQKFASVPSGQPFIPESQDLSFRSVYDNRASPPLRERRASMGKSPPRVEELASSQAASWCAPPSQIGDSYPLPDLQMLKATPTRVLEQYLKTFHATSLPGASSPRRIPESSHEALTNTGGFHIPSSIPIPDSEDAASRSLGHRSSTEVIPVTPRAPETSSRKRQQTVEAVIDETIYISSSAIDLTQEATSFRAESAPPLSKRQKGISEEATAVHLLRSSSDAGPARKRPTSPSSAVATEDVSNALEIRPPSPPVGIVDLEPSDLISEKLAKLARDLSSRYRPKAKRPTDPFERGYWLLDCTTWSRDTRLEAWIFLANYLRSGLAGWGVWCRRDASHDWIRLYCWAHVAKHTYLLLYLASSRHLKSTGAEWIDADGDMVMEVLPVERQQT